MANVHHVSSVNPDSSVCVLTPEFALVLFVNLALKSQVNGRMLPTLLQYCVDFLKVLLLWVMKVHMLVLGSPNNRLTCMQDQKTFHFLIICIIFYLICSATPQQFTQRFIFQAPPCVALICSDWSISFKACCERSVTLCTALPWKQIFLTLQKWQQVGG